MKKKLLVLTLPVCLVLFPSVFCFSQITFGFSLSSNNILTEGKSGNTFLFPGIGGNFKMAYEGDTKRGPSQISFIFYEFGVNKVTNQEMNSKISGTVWTFYYTELDVKLLPVKKGYKWNLYALTGFGVHMMTLDDIAGHDYYASVSLGMGTYYKFYKQHRLELYVRPKYIFGLQFGQNFGIDMGLNIGFCAGCK
jgi:hypothetical protein